MFMIYFMLYLSKYTFISLRWWFLQKVDLNELVMWYYQLMYVIIH